MCYQVNLPSNATVAILSYTTIKRRCNNSNGIRRTLRRIGIPCKGPRFPLILRSWSRAEAWESAEGLSSRTARREGPRRLTSFIRAK